MKRREFLVRVSEVGGGVVLAPVILSVAGLTLPGCKQSAEGSGGPGTIFGVEFFVDPTGEPMPAGHTHDFFIPQKNILDPTLENGYSDVTSPTAGHRHTINLTVSQLQLIKSNLDNPDTAVPPTTGFTVLSTGTAHEHSYTVG